MKKRTRITALITTLCVCISLFVVGVLAATTASLSVTSTLKFSADGVYVMVDASLKQGADVETAQVLSGEGAPTGQTTYKAYSYSRASGQDYPNGEPSTKHFVDSTGAQASTWAIGDITYTSENVVVVYEFLVSNYSEFEVTGTVEGISEALASYTDQLSITTYTGTTSSDATATSSPTYTFNIPARTSETTPGQACYKIAVTLNKFTNDITTETIQIDVSFEKPPEPVYDYFTYSGNSITGLSDTYKNLETKPETLVIPSTDGEGNNITAIEDGSYSSPTFQGLESSKVIIQEGITSIGDYAFSGCSGLTSVSLPSKLTSIGYNAFEDCSSLTSITIPSSVTSIGSAAFRGCSGLTGNIVLPEGVTEIKSGVFENCKGITGLTLPSNLTTIGIGAFRYCGSLTGGLVMPESLIDIGANAFLGSALTSMNYLGTLSQWYEIEFGGDGSNPTELTHELYIQGEKITDLVIPEDITSIGDYTFSGCSTLTGNLTIPEGVTSIGSSAFYGCSGLTGSLTIPEGVTSIGNSAFRGCSGLTGELIIPASVTKIEHSTFWGCSNLTSIVLPSSVTSIGNNAFNVCFALTSVNYLGTLQQWCLIEFGSDSNPTYYAHSLYIQGEEVTNLVIPEGITKIGDGTFSGCMGLTSVTLPSTLTSIGEYAFEDCRSLTSIEIPSGVTSIGRYAFRQCFKLTSVTFADPNGWWYASSSFATSGTSISATDLENTTTAATYLRSSYGLYYWKKS